MILKKFPTSPPTGESPVTEPDEELAAYRAITTIPHQTANIVLSSHRTRRRATAYRAITIPPHQTANPRHLQSQKPDEELPLIVPALLPRHEPANMGNLQSQKQTKSYRLSCQKNVNLPRQPANIAPLQPQNQTKSNRLSCQKITIPHQTANMVISSHATSFYFKITYLTHLDVRRIT